MTASPVSSAAIVPAPDIVRGQVERIIASEIFRRAERQSRFLRYVVEQALAGKTDRLKGYTIGLDVFDRAPDFDPNLDAIVRVEAGRLRAKLREYYRQFGADPVLIDLPRGTYAPVISHAGRGGMPSMDDEPPRAAVRGSVAVLPFRNLSGDAAQDYFSDGLTDAVITALARNPRLKVISLTSVMRFRNTQRPIPEIAEELAVTHVLEGTVLRDRDQVRVSAQLIEAATDHHVWADNFERDIPGVIRVQKELADIISTRLVRELSPNRAAPETAGVNAAAWDMYLLGRGYRRRLTREGLEKASECFRKAIDLDMKFAAAYAGAASCYCALGSYGFELEEPERLIPTGLEYSRRAMEIDPAQVESIVFTAIMTLKYEWDWPEAERLFRMALAASPNDARSHLQFSLYYESIGDHANAMAEAEQARQIDPLSTEANQNLAWQLHQAGREEEAQARLNWTLDLNPGFWASHWALGHVHLARGQRADAIAEFQKAVDTMGGYATPLEGLGYGKAVTGDRAGALAVIAKLEELSRKGYVSPCRFASIYAGLNDADRCFERLEQAYRLRSRSLAWLNVSREYTGLRSDPRFTDLIRRIGIPAA
jgi:TolB-like protein/Flp pilus assembly protein TadD